MFPGGARNKYRLRHSSLRHWSNRFSWMSPLGQRSSFHPVCRDRKSSLFVSRGSRGPKGLQSPPICKSAAGIAQAKHTLKPCFSSFRFPLHAKKLPQRSCMIPQEKRAVYKAPFSSYTALFPATLQTILKNNRRLQAFHTGNAVIVAKNAHLHSQRKLRIGFLCVPIKQPVILRGVFLAHI